MLIKKTYILIILIIWGFAMQVVFASTAFALYVSPGNVTSTNLLSGSSASSISNFHYNISSLPGNSSATIQFSTDSTNWYSAAGVLNSSTPLAVTGGADINLSSLGWSGNAFYYKITINSTSDFLSTPVIDDIRFDYTPASGYDNMLAVNNNGNVGIGSGGVAGSALSVLGGGVFGAGYFTNVAPSNGLLVQGNVGIGTTNPQWNLHIDSGTSASATIALTGNATGQTATDGLLLQYNSQGYLWNYENTSLSFGTNNLERVTIKNDGKVGIGTTSPSSILHVNGGMQVGAAPTGGDKGMGSINISGDIYKNNTAYVNPDYVFEKYFTGNVIKFAGNPGAAEYPGLKPLAEVRQFASDHNELPLIASSQGGLFGKGDSLLASVEESYIYLFDHEQRIVDLNLSLEGIAGTVTPLPGSATETFYNAFFKNMFAKVTIWLADAGNGIGDFIANRVRTKEICVAKADGTDFCANGDQLQAALNGNGGVVAPPSAPVTSPVVPPVTPPVTPPTCVVPQILNNANDACIDPAPPATPTCVDPQVLNTTTNTCEDAVSAPETPPTQ